MGVYFPLNEINRVEVIRFICDSSCQRSKVFVKNLLLSVSQFNNHVKYSGKDLYQKCVSNEEIYNEFDGPDPITGGGGGGEGGAVDLM